MKRVRLFTFPASQELAAAVGSRIGLTADPLKVERFPDGEKRIQPLERSAGERAIVFHSLTGEPQSSPDEKILELAFFLQTLRDQGFSDLTAVVPYLAYSRSDQRQQSFDPLYLKSVAKLWEGAGLSRVITLDVHNLPAFQNAFRSAIALNLETAPLFSQALVNFEPGRLLVLSPDLGGIKRAYRFHLELAAALQRPVQFSFLGKLRTGDILAGGLELEKAREAQVILYDDIISTGGTVLRAMQAAREAGAAGLTVLASHGIFAKNLDAILDFPLLRRLWVTDSNPAVGALARRQGEKLQVLGCAPLIAAFLQELIDSPGGRS